MTTKELLLLHYNMKLMQIRNMKSLVKHPTRGNVEKNKNDWPWW
jgi:hypothetical protein